MNIAQLEQEIADRLATINIQDLEVLVVAEKQKDYKKAFDVPRIVVMLREITYEKPDRIEDVGQRATAIVEVILQSRWLRADSTHTGIYALYDEARKKLVGYQPSSYDPIYGVDFRIENYEENVFSYCFTVATRCRVVQDEHDPNTTGILLRQVTFIHS